MSCNFLLYNHLLLPFTSNYYYFLLTTSSFLSSTISLIKLYAISHVGSLHLYGLGLTLASYFFNGAIDLVFIFYLLAVGFIIYPNGGDRVSKWLLSSAAIQWLIIKWWIRWLTALHLQIVAFVDRSIEELMDLLIDWLIDW